jgi:hypothetical protein
VSLLFIGNSPWERPTDGERNKSADSKKTVLLKKDSIPDSKFFLALLLFCCCAVPESLGHCSSTSSRLYPVLHACRKMEEHLQLLLPQRLDDFDRKKIGRKKAIVHR